MQTPSQTTSLSTLSLYRRHAGRAVSQAGQDDLRNALTALALRPAYGVTQALAGVIARSWERRGPRMLPLLDLDPQATRALMEAHFPGADVLLPCAWSELEQPAVFARSAALDELIALLLSHRTVEDEDSRWLAHALVTACLGSEPLWEEMRFASNAAFSDLMHGFFASLAVLNRRDETPWKTFLFGRLEAERRRFARAG